MIDHLQFIQSKIDPGADDLERVTIVQGNLRQWADEIEHLRAAVKPLADLEAKNGHVFGRETITPEHVRTARAALGKANPTAEIGRLRAALTSAIKTLASVRSGIVDGYPKANLTTVIDYETDKLNAVVPAALGKAQDGK